MRAKRVLTGLGVATVVALTATGCSTVSTEPDQIGLHYSGGPIASKSFKGCVDPSTRENHGPGERFYLYPTRQISYDATGGSGSESSAFTVVSQDNAEMRVPVTVTLTLKTDCNTLKAFHENLANKYHAWWGGSDVVDSNDDKVPDGWVTMLNFVIGKPLDTTLDRVSQQYPWRKLWNDPTTKTAIETTVEKDLPARLKEQAGGDYFTVNSVLVQKPDPTNNKLKQAVADEQAAVATANSAKAQADADKAAADAQIAVARSRGASTKAEVDALGGPDAWLKKYAIDKGISPWPNPVVAGSGSK